MSRKKSAAQQITVLEKVADLAMSLAGRHLADYGATTSRHDFTQRQLMSCLVLRAYLKTTYRGVLEVLALSPALRRSLGLAEKLPHFTTLQKFSGRSQVVAIVQKMIGHIGAASAAQRPGDRAAMDATGLATSTASEYFRSRTGTRCNQWVKVSVIILCTSLLPLSLVVSLGPSNDRRQAPELLAQAQAVARPATLYADGGYDAEWIHAQCREQWGVESVIKPLNHRPDGTRSGRWRSQMSPEHMQARGYGQRWAVESFFSGLKRTMGAALNARRSNQMLAEASFRVLAYALRR
jgi:transposase